VTGIAGKKDFCTIFISKAMMNSEIGFGRKVLQAFEENEISFEHMPSGIDTMTIGFNKNLVSHRSRTQDTPCRPVIVQLLGK
jgi:aspartate kinase